jgi:hypothetical protein
MVMRSYRCVVFATALVTLLLAGSLASASWDYLSPSPSGNTINAGWSPDGGTTTFFVGDGGLILKQSAAGAEIMDSGTLSPLRAVHGTSAVDIWAVGGSALAETPEEKSIILHFDGVEWTRMGMLSAAQPAELSATYEARDIYAAGSQPGEVWAIGWGGVPWRWQGGTDWVSEPVNIDYQAFPQAQYGDLNALFGFSANDIFAVGSYGTVLHRDAAGWQLVRQFETEQPGYSGSSTSFNLLQDVWGPDADHVFACGNAGQVYRLDRSQATPEWQRINEGGFIFSAYDLSAMGGSGPEDVWFVGAGGVLRHWHGPDTPEGLDNYDSLTGDYKKRSTLVETASGEYWVAGQGGLIEKFASATPSLTPWSTPTGSDALLKYAGWAGRLWMAPDRTDAESGVYTWERGKLRTHQVPGLLDGAVTVFETFAADDIWLVTTTLSQTSVMQFDGASWKSMPIPGNYGWPISGAARSAPDGYAILRGLNWAEGMGESGGNPCYVGSTALACLNPLLARDGFYLDIIADEDARFWAVGASVEETSAGSGAWRATGGRVVSGDNGTWSLPVELGPDILNAVAAGAGHVVAVGENRAAYYAFNGGPWQPVAGIDRRTPVNGDAIESFANVIHAGGGVFYAVSNTGSGWTDGNKGFIWRIENGQGQRVAGGYTSQLFGLAAEPNQGIVFASGSAGAVVTNDLAFSEQQVGAIGVDVLLPLIMLLLD